MIFLTVGTQVSFRRLAEAVDGWCADNPKTRVFGQLGAMSEDDYRPAHFSWVEFLDPADFSQRLASAELIVAHAGMGSIISALSLAKPIVIMPRRAELGEHRNDHQMATARQMESRPGVHVAWRDEDLAPKLDGLVGAGAGARQNGIAPFADRRLTDGLRRFIFAGQPVFGEQTT
ncbi:MAG: glycosyltransferase [Pseudomonadota bacterium]